MSERLNKQGVRDLDDKQSNGRVRCKHFYGSVEWDRDSQDYPACIRRCVHCAHKVVICD